MLVIRLSTKLPCICAGNSAACSYSDPGDEPRRYTITDALDELNTRLFPIARKGSVRFDSVRFRTFLRQIIGSVRFGAAIHFSGSMQLGLRFSARHGSVWFGSVRFRVRFRPVPKLNISVRFGRFGSVSHSILNDDTNPNHINNTNHTNNSSSNNHNNNTYFFLNS